MIRGVLTGCNEAHEWMLKWWWKNFSKHNTYPVTFCDFGMSPSAQIFCKQVGTLLPKQELQLNNFQEEIDVPWKQHVPSYRWKQRSIWFQKPFAFSRSPYQRTLWIDIDCEVRKPLDSLMNLPLSQAKMAFSTTPMEYTKKSRAQGVIHKEAHILSSGVLLFEKESPLLQAWIEYIFCNHHKEFSEDTSLSNLLTQYPFDPIYFSDNYNFNLPDQDHSQVYIYHYQGNHQKRALYQSIDFT